MFQGSTNGPGEPYLAQTGCSFVADSLLGTTQLSIPTLYELKQILEPLGTLETLGPDSLLGTTQPSLPAPLLAEKPLLNCLFQVPWLYCKYTPSALRNSSGTTEAAVVGTYHCFVLVFPLLFPWCQEYAHCANSLVAIAMCGDQPVLQSKLPPRAFISVHLQPQSCLVLPVKSGQEKNMFGQILFSRFICLLMLLPASAMWHFGAQLHWLVSVHALIGDLKKWYWAELENEENAKKEVVCWKVSALSLIFCSFICSLLPRQRIWYCRCVLPRPAKDFMPVTEWLIEAGDL